MNDRVTSLSLIERLRNADDHEAWTRFQATYGNMIRRTLLARGVQANDADDIQQEVMRLATTELVKFRHNGRTGALRAWLRQVVANRLRTFWRQKNRPDQAVGNHEYAPLADQLADPHSRLSQIWDEEYQRATCAELLELVKDEFQQQTMQAFRGVAIEGRPAPDVAIDLEMSANAVRIAQSRVLRRLRELAQGMLD